MSSLIFVALVLACCVLLCWAASALDEQLSDLDDHDGGR